MNRYAKFCPNVFVAECDEKHEKGEVITLETKYGKSIENVVFNLVASRGGKFYYSVVRADGFDYKAFCESRAARIQGFANTASRASDVAYVASSKDREFLSMGEPVKIGHHSEKRHRRIIEQAQKNMTRSVELSAKADSYESRLAYWEEKASQFNLSMPDCIGFYEYKVEEATKYHEGIKCGEIKKEHAYTLTYAKKARNEAEKNLALAKRLWG